MPSISFMFYSRIFCTKFWCQKLQKLKCNLRRLYNLLWYKKGPHKTMMKLTRGLDFINVLRTAFTPVVPQSVRTQSSHQYLFTLLGPTSVKAVRRTLMKLTPDSDILIAFACFVFVFLIRHSDKQHISLFLCLNLGKSH